MLHRKRRHSSVERKGGDGSDDRYSQNLPDPLPPRSDRIGDDIVRALFTDLFEMLIEQFRGGPHQKGGECFEAVGELGQVGKK
jgi:hypothetical protein